MKKIIKVIVATSILSACSSSHLPYDQQQFTTKNYQENIVNAIEYADSFIEFDEIKLSKAALDADDLSTLLKADIDFNQGAYAKAGDSYYYLANKYHDPRIIYKAIICYEQSGSSPEQIAKFNQMINQLITVVPDSKVAKLFGILPALQQNNIDLAKRNLNYIIKVNKSKTRSVLLFIATLTSSGMSKIENDNLSNFAKYVRNKYSEYPEANLFAVVAYSITGNQAELFSSLDKINKLYPDWDVPVFWSAGVLVNQGQLELLSNMVQHEIDTATHPSINLTNLYIATLIKANKLQEASNFLESAQKATPNNSNLLINSVIINYRLNQVEKSIQDLQQAADNNHNLGGVVNLALANLYDSESNPESAIANYKIAINVNPVIAPAANLGLLKLYMNQGNYRAANDFIHTMAEMTNLNARDSALLQLSAYTEMGNYDQAYKLAEKNIKQYPKDKTFVYYYSSLSAMTGRTKQAINWYKKYIKLDSTNAVAYNDLGFLLADKTSRYKEAYLLAKKAYQISPQDPAILDTLGWASFKLVKYTQAESYLSTAYKVTQDRDIALHLQQVYRAEGKNELADKIVVISADMQKAQLNKSLLDQSMFVLMYAQFGMDFNQ